tara:strand:+ start:3152 stop:3358 length:207 start_codon:yes stop_codon:yes gene_type:complete
MPKENLRYDPTTKSVVSYDGKGIEVGLYSVSIEADRSGGVKVSFDDKTEFVPYGGIEESALRLTRRSI